MGFVDQAARILKYNHKLLKEKNYFSKLSESKSKNAPSEISSELFKRSISIFEIRVRKRRLILSLVLVPVLFIFIVLISLYFFT